MSEKIIKTPYDEITYKIIGCAMAVHNELGPGLREDTYERALTNKFSEARIRFETQRLFAVHDDPEKRRLAGYYIPDFVVDESIIVEIKALSGLDNSHVAQVIGNLTVSGCALGLLINFGERSLRYKRILPPQEIIEHLINRQWLFVPDWLKNEK